MVTLKRIRGKHIVAVDGNETVYDMFWDALEFIYSVHFGRAKDSL